MAKLRLSRELVQRSWAWEYLTALTLLPSSHLTSLLQSDLLGEFSSVALRHNQGDVVLLFAECKLPHFLLQRCNHCSRRLVPISEQSFCRTLFSKLRSRLSARLRYAICVQHQRITGKQLLLFHHTLPIRKQAEYCRRRRQPLHASILSHSESAQMPAILVAQSLGDVVVLRIK